MSFRSDQVTNTILPPEILRQIFNNVVDSDEGVKHPVSQQNVRGIESLGLLKSVCKRWRTSIVTCPQPFYHLGDSVISILQEPNARMKRAFELKAVRLPQLIARDAEELMVRFFSNIPLARDFDMLESYINKCLKDDISEDDFSTVVQFLGCRPALTPAALQLLTEYAARPKPFPFIEPLSAILGGLIVQNGIKLPAEAQHFLSSLGIACIFDLKFSDIFELLPAMPFGDVPPHALSLGLAPFIQQMCVFFKLSTDQPLPLNLRGVAGCFKIEEQVQKFCSSKLLKEGFFPKMTLIRFEAILQDFITYFGFRKLVDTPFPIESLKLPADLLGTRTELTLKEFVSFYGVELNIGPSSEALPDLDNNNNYYNQ